MMRIFFTVVITLLVGCNAGNVKKADKPQPVMAQNTWKGVHCRVNKFTDAKACSIGKFFPSYAGGQAINPVRVEVSESYTFISFGFHTHPGALGRVRINKHQEIIFDESPLVGIKAETLVSQMLEGGEGIAKAVAWPSKHVTFEFDLDGFSEAYGELLNKLRQK